MVDEIFASFYLGFNIVRWSFKGGLFAVELLDDFIGAHTGIALRYAP